MMLHVYLKEKGFKPGKLGTLYLQDIVQMYQAGEITKPVNMQNVMEKLANKYNSNIKAVSRALDYIKKDTVYKNYGVKEYVVELIEDYESTLQKQEV